MSFVNNHKQKNTGKLLAIDALLHEAETDSNKIAIAMQANNQLQADDYMEQTQQNFNNLYLTYLQHNKTLDIANLSKLESIANLCPTYYGGVVYQARAVLYDLVKKQYSNDCEKVAPPASNKKIAQGVSEKTTLLVYPNPATNDLYIETGTYGDVILKLYNSLGELVFAKTVTNNQRLDINNLPSSIYTYKIYSNGAEIKADKLMIIK